MKKKRPDIIVVQGMSQLLKKNIIDIPRFGVVNIHRSFLPEYRGPNPAFWQYYDFVDHLGLTIHFIDEGEDAGDIISQVSLPFPRGAKSPGITDLLLGDLAPKMLLDSLEKIEKKDVVVTVQKNKASPTRRAKNVAHLEHDKVVEWHSWPIERVWHILRGTEMWLNAVQQPGGWLSGQRWVIGEYEKKSLPENLSDVGKVKKQGMERALCSVGMG